MKLKLVFGVVLFATLFFGVASLRPASASAATINVTTTTDEDSAPAAGSGCSIFEAVQAANNDAAYGGCIAGSGADTISIPSGNYTMGASNAWSDTITVSSSVTIEGPSTGSLPVIDARGKSPAPQFNLHAPDITVKNLEFIFYDLDNWDDSSSNSYPNLTLQNITYSGDTTYFARSNFTTNNTGLHATNITLQDKIFFDINADDAVVQHMSGTNQVALVTDQDVGSGEGGDNITVQDLVFTDNSSVFVYKYGPGEVLLEDVSIDSPGTDAFTIYTNGSDDDGTTILRRVTVTGVTNDSGIEYRNDNSTARHVLRVEDSLFENNSQAITFNSQSVERTEPSLIITTTVFKNNGPWDSTISLFAPEGYMQISRSTFVNSTLDDWVGAAIYSEGRLDVTNSTFYNNKPVPTTGNPGGAIYLDVFGYVDGVTSPVPSRFINNTFANNDADSGSAIYIADYNDNTSSRDTAMDPVMINNLFTGNVGTACAAGSSVSGSSSNSYGAQFGTGSAGNISTDSSCDSATVVSDAKVDSALSDATTAGQVGYNSTGGYLPILKLLAGSPAIDTGTATNCPATDEAGTARPQGTQCDVGAYEAVAAVLPGNPGGSTLANTGQASAVTSLVAAATAVAAYRVTAYAKRQSKIYRLGRRKY